MLAYIDDFLYSGAVSTFNNLVWSDEFDGNGAVNSLNWFHQTLLPNGTGWYNIALISNPITAVTGNAATYELDNQGSPTTITLSSSDPDGIPLQWSHQVTSGSLGGTTITNVNNVFTITPSTNNSDAGEFTVSFIATNGENQETWRPKRVYHYIQWENIEPDFVVDISNFIDKKEAAILAYSSQFYNPNSNEPVTPIATKNFLDSIHNRSRELGRLIGTEYAEGFTVERYLAVNSLGDLI